jgi:hypothetical protein
MAYYFLTASKDASVYIQQPFQNTGLDEMLEISKVYYGNIKDLSRILLRFDTSHLSASLSNGSMKLENATLVLRQTESEEIPLEYTIYAYMVSGSWQMGKGTRFDEVSTQGVTWDYREGDSNLEWLPSGQFSAGSTGSYEGRGGVWYTANASSQSFNYQTADINMDVKSPLKAWLSGSVENNGFIIKYNNSVEDDTEDYGILKFFSKETNTIHQPKIRIGWDDQSYVTGQLNPLTANDIKVNVVNFKNKYKVNSTAKIRIFARDLYPLKTFTNSFAYNTAEYLPTSSYYQIKDAASDDVIIPFDNYSKISCDETGNYIKVNFSNWQANRIYKLEFKVEQNGDVQYFDENITFSLENN